MKLSTKKNKYIKYVMIVAETIMLLSALLLLIRPLEKYEFFGTELEASGAIFLDEALGMEKGYYIDNTMVSEDSNLDEFVIRTPDIDLKRGSYQVKISYSTETNFNTYSAYAIPNYYLVKIGRTNEGLDRSKNECLFSFEAHIPVEGYRIDVNFSGDNYIFVNGISIVETNAYKVKYLVLILFACFIINTIYFISIKTKWLSNKDNLVILFLLGIIIVLASTPTLVEFLYEGHDLDFHLNRIEGIKNALLAGNFPVRMHYSTLHGAGYPTSVFYGDIFLYIPALLRIAGWSVQSAYQFYVILVNALSCLVMYFVLNRMIKDYRISICGAFLYMMAPYRLECIYLRAAVGEYTAMVFYPLVVYGLYCIYSDDLEEDNCSWLVLALAYTGLINCHIISTFSAALLTAAFCVVNIRKTFTKKIFLRLTKAALVTVGLCLWFLVPFMDYMRLDVGINQVKSQGIFAGRGVTLSQLLSVFPQARGYALTAFEELYDTVEMSYALGGGFILTLIIYVVCYIYFDKNSTSKEKIGKTLFFFSLFTLFMATRYFPWDILEQLGGVVIFITQGIQFPWRFLGAAVVLLAFVAAFAMDRIKTEGKTELFYSVVAVMLTVSFISGMHFMETHMEYTRKIFLYDEQDVSSDAIGMGEYLPQGAPRGFDNEVLHDDEIQILSTLQDKDEYFVECSNLADSVKTIEVPILYYTNYRAIDTATGTRIQIAKGQDCRIKIEIPEYYTGTVAIEYCSPWYWRMSELVSLLVVIGLLLPVKKGHLINQLKNTKNSN